MSRFSWEYLKQFWTAGETWLETEEAHVATLVARALHWERSTQNDVVEESAAAVEAPEAPEVTEAPQVTEAPEVTEAKDG